MLSRLYSTITRSGVSAALDESLSDKIITRNRLAFFCAFFSSLYLLYFISNRLVLPSVGISISIILFVLSIIYNRRHKIGFSALIILIATNYSVLSTSLIFGFGSGFHLYLLTSPLIIYVLFDFKRSVYNIMAIMSYCLTFIVVFFADKNYHYHVYDLSSSQSEFFYIVNFIFAIVILIVLFLYFMFNNRSVNSLLVRKNQALLAQQSVLRTEIEQRSKAEERLSGLLKEKEILLSEVHHRVKNNLAVISGLVEYQTLTAKEGEQMMALLEHKNRIKSIALLHEKINLEAGEAKIKMDACINELLRYIALTLNFKTNGITVNTKMDRFDLGMEKALALSLLINELFSGAGRASAKKIKDCVIDLEIKIEGNKAVLRYNDNYHWLFWEENSQNSFSNGLVEVLSGQLNDEGFTIDAENSVFKIEFSIL
jgi:two-component sensor histidine kinase